MSTRFHAHLLRYALWRGAPALLNLATVTLLTAVLTPERYGVYALVLAGAALWNAAFVSWAQQALVRQWRLAADAESRDALVASIAAGVSMAFGAAMLVGMAVMAISRVPVGAAPLRSLLPLVPLLAAAQALRLLLLELGRARLRPDAFGALIVGQSLLAALGAPLVAWLTHDVGAMILVLVIAEVAPCLPVLWQSRQRLRRALHWRHVQRHSLLALLRVGMPLTLSSLLAQGLFAGTRALVAALLGTAAAGIYAAAYDLAQRAVTASMQLVSLGTVPLLLDAVARRDDLERDQLLRRNLVWSLLAGAPLALLLALMAGPISATFLSAAFAPAAAACIPWVAAGVLANRLRTNHADLPFMVVGRTSRQLVAGVVGASVGLAGTWLLAPRLGISGAAMATTSGYVAALVCSALLGRRDLALPWPGRDLARLALSLLPLAVLTLWQPAPGVQTLVTAALLLGLVGLLVVRADVDGLQRLVGDRLERWRQPTAALGRAAS